MLNILNKPPTHGLKRLNSRVLQGIDPISHKWRSSSAPIIRRFSSPETRGIMSFIRYRGVAALLAANVGAYMILNSQFMKQRSSNDGPPRVDRHFIASRYNLANWRIWSVPFSLFNHGDSLMQLVINCAGLAIVGPAVEMAFGAGVLVSGFLIAGSLGALAEVAIGNHWCRGSSAGVTGLLGIGAFASPFQIVSMWGVWNVRAASLALTIFGFESLVGLFGSKRSEMAHIAHATGILSAIPILYYMRWFR